ncbi:MAG: hypothetical protein JXA46_17400 [Dehalococcoidales bacterium]|nr:hypothetical protein [Dehalococcoidales bacterium]
MKVMSVTSPRTGIIASFIEGWGMLGIGVPITGGDCAGTEVTAVIEGDIEDEPDTATGDKLLEEEVSVGVIVTV